MQAIFIVIHTSLNRAKFSERHLYLYEYLKKQYFTE